MPIEIHAKGTDPAYHLKRQLVAGERLRMGRSPKDGWEIPWDLTISREQADLFYENGVLKIRCVDEAPNSIRIEGRVLREVEVRVGDSFAIGQSRFLVSQGERSGSEVGGTIAFDKQFDMEPRMEFPFSPVEMRRAQFGQTETQMELLSHLPEMISRAEDDASLAAMVVSMLLKAIPQAEVAAVVRFDAKDQDPVLLHLDSREDFSGQWQPSRRLIDDAVRGEQYVLHIWSPDGSVNKFTVSRGLGWAFCAPILSGMQGWCLCVSGEGARSGKITVTKEDLQGDLRFSVLVADFIGAIRQVRALEEQRTQLSSFFSPRIMERLAGKNARSELQATEQTVAVLFCDIRGFSRKAELHRENLPYLLKCVRAALSVMTGSILEQDGVVADFQGDAALGFWGWPVPLSQGSLPACRAALSINRGFASTESTSSTAILLKDFSVGIGISNGRALAGQIGTIAQAKVGVFGAVVNQGSRLEGIAKAFGVPICVDENTASDIERYLPRGEGRLMRLAAVRPYGVEKPIQVSALLPTSDEWHFLTDQMVADYEGMLSLVMAGDFCRANSALLSLPANFGPVVVLQSAISNVLQGHKDWDGIVRLKHK